MSQQNEPIKTLDDSSSLSVRRKRGRPRKHDPGSEPCVSTQRFFSAHSPLAQSSAGPSVRQSQRHDFNFNSSRQNYNPDGLSQTSHGDSNDLLGKTVSGTLDGKFDVGYLLTVRVGSSGPILKGLVFDPAFSVPLSEENDVAPRLPMLQRKCFIAQTAAAHRLSSTPLPKNTGSNVVTMVQPLQMREPSPLHTKPSPELPNAVVTASGKEQFGQNLISEGLSLRLSSASNQNTTAQAVEAYEGSGVLETHPPSEQSQQVAVSDSLPCISEKPSEQLKKDGKDPVLAGADKSSENVMQLDVAESYGLGQTKGESEKIKKETDINNTKSSPTSQDSAPGQKYNQQPDTGGLMGAGEFIGDAQNTGAQPSTSDVLDITSGELQPGNAKDCPPTSTIEDTETVPEECQGFTTLGLR